MSGWSRPVGMHTIGTPATRPFITVPWPPWVTSTSAWASTSRCGAERTTVTFVRRLDLLGVDGRAGRHQPADGQATERGHRALELVDVVHERGAHRHQHERAVVVAGGVHGSAHSGSSSCGPT